MKLDPASIPGQRLPTDDSGSPANVPSSDPYFAPYPDNPPVPLSFEIPKVDFENVFTALGGTAQAGLVFAPFDASGPAGLGQDPTSTLLWPSPTTPEDRNSGGGQSQSGSDPSQEKQVLFGSPALPGSGNGLSWMSPEGTGHSLDSPAGGSVPAAFTKDPGPPTASFDITKENFVSVFTALGGTLGQADLLFSQLDVDKDGILQAGEFRPVGPVAPALTSTNGPPGPAGLAAPGDPGNELGLQTPLGNPPSLIVR